MDHSRHSVPASVFVEEFESHRIDFVTTVPDMLQIALHSELERPDSRIRSINCTTEDQAVETAAGLFAGGRRAAILVQNQGFFAAINSVRALGLDGRIPLFMVMGQFGREWSNLGADPRSSKRLMVRMLEPLLETLDIPYWRLESVADRDNIGKACEAAFERGGPSALIVGHFVGFDQFPAQS
ncbi:MAG: thiamine pyrophosphate-binding protein [Variovorax paradoxus]|uniref:Thiamine pyrophosphate-binding protein n=1 Tax=Variovorax paradoxus TaxID=34073 RepID=A0A2W5QK84_VARPD|nr:MAG: thiamine pyrophosphate-binding protein [Variovorax paradoxus]